MSATVARLVSATAALLTMWMATAWAEGEGSAPTRPLRAAAGVHLRLEGATCTALRLEDVTPFAVTEIGSKMVKAAPSDVDAIVVRCSGDLVTISAKAPDGSERFYRADLSGTAPSVRPRIVAIAIGELVHDLELVQRPSSAPVVTLRPRVASETGTAPTRPAPSPGRVIHLAAFAQAIRFGGDGFWLLGGGLRFDYARAWWSLGFDAAAAAHDERIDTGTVRTLLADASPYAAFRWVRGPGTARLGGGYALGVGRIAGSAAEVRNVAATAAGPWGGPFALLALSYAVTNWLTIAARGQTGWATMSVVGQVCLRSSPPNPCDSFGPEFALRGFWTRVQIGSELTL